LMQSRALQDASRLLTISTILSTLIDTILNPILKADGRFLPLRITQILIKTCHYAPTGAQKFLAKPPIHVPPEKRGAKMVPRGLDTVMVPDSGSVQISLTNLREPLRCLGLCPCRIGMRGFLTAFPGRYLAFPA
jgi:hypothetical protein